MNGTDPRFQQKVELGFQGVVSAQRAIVYVDEVQERRSRLMMVELVVVVVCLCAFIYLEIRRVKTIHAELYEWLVSTGWSLCGPLSIILSIEWKWYNNLFGCGVTKNFSAAVMLAWYNKSLQPKLLVGGAVALQLIYDTSIRLSGSNQSAMQILCAAFQIRSTDPLARTCYQPCPNPTAGRGSAAMNYVQGAMGGMGSGAGVGFLLHSMEMGPAVGLAAIGVGIGLGLLGAQQQNSAEAENLRNACQTLAASTSCWLPPGVCTS